MEVTFIDILGELLDHDLQVVSRTRLKLLGT